MKIYFRILSFAKPYKRFLPRYAILALFAVLFGLINFTLLIPLLNVLFNTVSPAAPVSKPVFTWDFNYLTDLFNYFFNDILYRYGKLGALHFVCAIILVSVFFSNLFRYLAQRVLTSMRTYVVRNIREALFHKITKLHVGFFHSQRKGDLMSSLSNDVNEIETSVVSTVQVIFREPLMIIGYVTLLFVMSVKLTLFTLIILPVSGLIITSISRKLRRDANIGQQLLGNILSIIEETLSGVRIIKAFNAQKYINSKFDIENNRYRGILKSMWNKRELASPLSEFLGVSVVVGVIVYGGQLVLENRSELTASQFIAYIVLYSQILVPAKSISNAVTLVQRGIASGERILRVIDEPVLIKEDENPSVLKEFSGQIEFKNVSFRYDREDVLKNINLVIPKGRMIALVGQSGAGKSTLADLIPRFYDPTEGDILIDGIPVRKLRLKNLNSLMGIVTQESILFNDSIFNNIAFGLENIPEEDVIEAARIANAHEFIIRMEHGYHTNIGDRGLKLSGGQRQRLAIARAVLKNPPILILDEATSALDTESERLVQDALFRLMQNRTSIVIAHRLSTIQHADEIIVMQAGEIIETGQHNELMERNGVYRKLCDLQAFS